MVERLCKVCGGIYPEIYFYSRGMHTSRRKACKGCLDKRDDRRKQNNRFPSKTGSTRKRHAEKFGYSTEKLRMMGWETKRMANDCKHAYENNCIECGWAYSNMGHGTADITLDILNPALEPHYPSNVRWICATCNRRKGDMPLEQWMIEKEYWKQWEERNGPRQLSMFDDENE